MTRRWTDHHKDRRTSLDGQEVKVIDTLIAVYWPEARKGDNAAAAQLLKLMEMRIKLKEIAQKEWGREAGRRGQQKRSAV